MRAAHCFISKVVNLALGFRGTVTYQSTVVVAAALGC